MDTIAKDCKGPEETIAFGKEYARSLQPGDTIALDGDLGSGKTTFVKGIALGLGIEDVDQVKSPTFVLLHIYPTRIPLYHFDLYRLESAQELEAIGFDEFLNLRDSICCVEWADKAVSFLPAAARRITFEVLSENTRRITAGAEKKSGDSPRA